MGLQKKIFDFLQSPEKIELYRKSDTDFTRASPLSFPVVVSSILHLFKESVEFNLQETLPEITSKPVTGSAFSQARYKVKPGLFEDLNKIVAETYHLSNKKRWKGHCLLAGDGSTLNLPPSKDIEEHFGVNSKTDLGIKRYLARVFFFYDVLNDFVVEGKLSKMEKGEKTNMLESLETIKDLNSILIFDRGFGHFCTTKELINRQRKLCIRLPCENSNFAKSMLERPEEDFITFWHPSPKEKENAKKNDLDYDPIKVRVIKIHLDNGETELLITNLYDTNEYTIEDMGELYHLRWGVEEGFKNLKPKMKIEQFGCRKTEGIFQEFHAHIFCLNMVGLMGSIANEKIEKKTAHRKWKYKYNWQNAYRFLRGKILRFLLLDNIEILLDRLITQISSSTIAIIPYRQFVRDTRHRNKRGRITQFHK